MASELSKLIDDQLAEVSKVRDVRFRDSGCEGDTTLLLILKVLVSNKCPGWNLICAHPETLLCASSGIHRGLSTG